MRRLYLRDCAPGDVLEDVFVITGKQFSATNTNKYFIKGFISDRTCQLTARLWNATRDIFNAMPESGFLRIRGRVENYQNNLQVIIEQMWPAKEGTFEIGDLIPQTEKDIAQMCRRIIEICQSVQNRHLAALLQAYLDDEALMSQFCKAPAAMSFHHAYIGGLLEHTLNAMEVADAIAPFYPNLNRDLVIAGIFLHDIAKIWELSYECAFGYTDAGHLVGHIVKSAIWIEQKAQVAKEVLGEPIPQALIDVLQHIVVSHHGTPEFGAIKLPSTPEAIAVHFIENMDAKLMMSLAATRGDNAAGEGNWTEYLKALGGRLYRPDVAPPEAASGEPDERTPSSGHGEPPAPGNANSLSSASSALPTLKVSINNPLFETAPPRKK